LYSAAPSTYFATTVSAGKGFDNQEKKISKAFQKKKDKQVALRITRKEAQ
jgi:uncharacterized membrane protein YvbJ